MKNKHKEKEFNDQYDYDRIKLCQYCGYQLTRLKSDISLVRCPKCGNKARSDEDREPMCVDTSSIIARHSNMNEIRGVFTEDVARRLKEQIDGIYDINDLIDTVS